MPTSQLTQLRSALRTDPRVWLWRWGDIEMYVTRILTITDNGVDYLWKPNKRSEQEKGSISWNEIHAAYAFKRDLFGYDLICLQLSKEDRNEGIEVDEEDPKWNELMIELSRRMDGFKEWDSWFSEVAFPPFETNLTRVYEKNKNSHQGASHNGGKPPRES